MPKGSDTLDAQSNYHIYFPANGEAKINYTWLNGSVCVWAGAGPSWPCMWFHPYPRAHRATQCLRGLRVFPLCVSMGWTCHHAQPRPSPSSPPCIMSPCAFRPPQGCSGSSSQQRSCCWVGSELPEQDWTLSWDQGRATSCTEGSAPSWLLNMRWQTSSSPCSRISRSPLQVCNLRKTNKCRAAWLYLSEI